MSEKEKQGVPVWVRTNLVDPKHTCEVKNRTEWKGGRKFIISTCTNASDPLCPHKTKWRRI